MTTNHILNDDLLEVENDTENIRDENGRFVKGVSGNPAGKPKGTSITAVLRKKYEEACKLPENAGKTNKEVLCEKIIEAAIGGDFRFIDLSIKHLDGMPIQKTISDNDTNFKITVEVVDPKNESK